MQLRPSTKLTQRYHYCSAPVAGSLRTYNKARDNTSERIVSVNLCYIFQCYGYIRIFFLIFKVFVSRFQIVVNLYIKQTHLLFRHACI